MSTNCLYFRKGGCYNRGQLFGLTTAINYLLLLSLMFLFCLGAVEHINELRVNLGLLRCFGYGYRCLRVFVHCVVWLWV